jgi:hypothetical protein
VWREYVQELSSTASFAEAPDDEAAVRQIAERLGQPVPDDLAGFLLEVGEVRDEYGFEVVLSAERIVADNLYFRSAPDFAELYMPFDPLMFFGTAGNGDLFAFVRRPVRPDVFVWDHESDSRYWVANDLRDFLSRYFGSEDNPEWYRDQR